MEGSPCHMSNIKKGNVHWQIYLTMHVSGRFLGSQMSSIRNPTYHVIYLDISLSCVSNTSFRNVHFTMSKLKARAHMKALRLTSCHSPSFIHVPCGWLWSSPLVKVGKLSGRGR